jgi:hypothetical protein
MASIATMVGAAIVNAIAFTAGNALYDKFVEETAPKKGCDMTRQLKINKKL